MRCWSLTVAVSSLADFALVVAVDLALGASISLTTADIRFSIQGDEVGFTTSVAVFLVALLGVLGLIVFLVG